MKKSSVRTGWIQEFTYIIRYAGSGAINSSIGFIVIFSAMALGVTPIISNILGYIVGFFFGFVLSKKFVFRSNGHYVGESVRYLVSFIISFLLNLLVLYVALNYFSFNAIFAQILAAVFYTSSMYLMARIFVFNTKRG